MAFEGEIPSGASALHSIDAEQAVLGACLYDDDVLLRVRPKLEASQFYDPFHGALYAAMLRLNDAGTAVSPLSVGLSLGADSRPDGIDVDRYLADIQRSVPSTVAAIDYAGYVVELSQRREIVRIAEEGATLAKDSGEGEAERIVEDMQARLHALEQRSDGRGVSGPADQTTEWIDGVISRCQSGTIPGCPTGLKGLDDVLGGLQRDNLYVVAGRPGMAKSIVAQMMAEASLGEDRAVTFFSLEMPQRQLRSRFASSLLFDDGPPISFSDIDKGALNLTQQEKLRGLVPVMSSPLLHIDDRSGHTASYVAGCAKRWYRAQEKAGRTPGVIIVDYLGRMRGEPGERSEVIIEGRKAEILKNLARELSIPVVALCQLNRGVEGRDDKRPMLSDLRQSGIIEQEADAVLMLYRPAYYLRRMPEADPAHEHHLKWRDVMKKNASRLEILVEKNRHGPPTIVEAFVDVRNAAIRDAAPEWWGVS